MTSNNTVKTVLLLGLLSVLLIYGGQMLGGRFGLYIGITLALVSNAVGYFFSDKIALAMYSAQPVSESENPEVYRRVAPMVRNLCQRMGLPMPRLWLIPEDSPNAFATGRNPAHASVAFTNGALALMDDRELEGVIAHELGHVLHRDILISSVAATIAAAITSIASLARWSYLLGGGGGRDNEDRGGGALGALLMLFLAPIAALMIQMWISRTREFAADEASAKYTGTPYGLIAALGKLDTWSKQIPLEASPATAHMFIIQPFSGQSFLRLFSTHPSTEERIARLQALR